LAKLEGYGIAHNTGQLLLASFMPLSIMNISHRRSDMLYMQTVTPNVDCNLRPAFCGLGNCSFYCFTILL